MEAEICFENFSLQLKIRRDVANDRGTVLEKKKLRPRGRNNLLDTVRRPAGQISIKFLGHAFLRTVRVPTIFAGYFEKSVTILSIWGRTLVWPDGRFFLLYNSNLA